MGSKISILLFTLLFMPVYCLAQAQTDPEFLRENKHYKEVVKETKQLEKNLPKKAVKPAPKITPTPKTVPVIEETTSEEIEAQEEAIQEEPADGFVQDDTSDIDEEKTEEGSELSPNDKVYKNWLLSVLVSGKMQATRAKDQYDRNLKLSSSPGIGGKLGFGYRFNKYFAAIADYSIDRITYNSFDSFTVNQNKSYNMGGKFGARLYMTERFSLELLAAIEQHYIVYTSSPTVIEIDGFTNGAIALGINYSIVETTSFLLFGRTDIKITLPVSKVLWKTSTGLGLGTELNFGVPIGDGSSFYMNLGLEYVNLKPSIVRQYSITGSIGVGFTLALR
jgi:hypothetical protein